jgi:hypothetical protein
MQSPLNPNSKPFPAYKPSPIAPPKKKPTNSPKSTDSWSSRSNTHNSQSSNTQSTPFPTYQIPQHMNGNGNDIKQFGQGWSSTPTYAHPVVKHNASMSDMNHLHPNPITTPVRTRSPSMPALHTFGESDPIVLFGRDRYKHLQVDRTSKYDSVNGHSYISNSNSNNTLGHSTSIPDLVGGYHNHNQGQGFRRSSLVNSWRENIPEDSEVEHLIPIIQGRGYDHQQRDREHTLASSRSVPAFATGAIAAGLSPTGQPTQSRNSTSSFFLHLLKLISSLHLIPPRSDHL